jgi:hypothetical protein
MTSRATPYDERAEILITSQELSSLSEENHIESGLVRAMAPSRTPADAEITVMTHVSKSDFFIIKFAIRRRFRSPHSCTPSEANAASAHSARCNAQLETLRAIPSMTCITLGKMQHRRVCYRNYPGTMRRNEAAYRWEPSPSC